MTSGEKGDYINQNTGLTLRGRPNLFLNKA